MPYSIGTDEAGYGPNLGPLTIGGTSWRLPQPNLNLYDLLAPVVCQGKPSPDQIQLADSKKVYQSTGVITGLETSVLAILFALHGSVPRNLKSLARLCCTEAGQQQLADQPGCDFASIQLPIRASLEAIKTLGRRFGETLDKADIQLQAVQCELVFPSEFNRQVEALGNKAHLLSSRTLALASRLIQQFSQDEQTDTITIVCDKHGGRSKYAAMVQHWLNPNSLLIDLESRDMSQYRFEAGVLSGSIQFKTKGESFLPTALASMVAKYLREVCMAGWNQFWSQHVPDIRPTKGYPVDAKRFKKEIEQAQRKLGIQDEVIWRSR